MLLSTAFATVSCQEFLSEQLPQGTLSEEQALDSKNTVALVISIVLLFIPITWIFDILMIVLTGNVWKYTA